jgi:hypothetical protein
MRVEKLLRKEKLKFSLSEKYRTPAINSNKIFDPGQRKNIHKKGVMQIIFIPRIVW